MTKGRRGREKRFFRNRHMCWMFLRGQSPHVLCARWAREKKKRKRKNQTARKGTERMKEIGGENEITNFRYHMPGPSCCCALYAYGSSHYYLRVFVSPSSYSPAFFFFGNDFFIPQCEALMRLLTINSLFYFSLCLLLCFFFFCEVKCRSRKWSKKATTTSMTMTQNEDGQFLRMAKKTKKCKTSEDATVGKSEIKYDWLD